MNSLWKIYESKNWVIPFLGYAIFLFLFTSIMLFIILIIIRKRKIKNNKLESIYIRLIENILLNVLFSDKKYAELKEDPSTVLLWKDNYFRNHLMLSVINLHQNYEGLYAKKLEQFYYDSNLIKDSFQKLRSRNWETKCKAIEELSEMNVSKVFKIFIKLSKTKNKTLKIESIKGCIKLNGSEGITHLMHHLHPIDQWTQLNIIHALKHGDLEHTTGIDQLLTSSNQTVVSLGLKTINTLHLSLYEKNVRLMIEATQNQLLKTEAIKVLKNLAPSSTSIQ